jgi:hypothetical protein
MGAFFTISSGLFCHARDNVKKIEKKKRFFILPLVWQKKIPFSNWVDCFKGRFFFYHFKVAFLSARDNMEKIKSVLPCFTHQVLIFSNAEITRAWDNWACLEKMPKWGWGKEGWGFSNHDHNVIELVSAMNSGKKMYSVSWGCW